MSSDMRAREDEAMPMAAQYQVENRADQRHPIAFFSSSCLQDVAMPGNYAEKKPGLRQAYAN